MPALTNLTYESRGGVVVARITTPNVSEREGAGLLFDLSALAQSHGGRIVLDLSEVLMVTSAGLGMFITLRKACAAAGAKGAVVLLNASDNIKTLLEITKLQKLFLMAWNLEAAVGSFS